MRGVRVILGGIFLGLLFGFFVAEKVADETTKLNQQVENEVLRFHVRANSDSDIDQKVKLKVKDAVVKSMKPVLAKVDDREESKEILRTHLQDIKTTAQNVLTKEGFKNGVKVYFSTEEFPVKQYGDLVFPSGTYEALRIDIGEAEGKNWWCMMYPPLCMVDATYGVVPSHSKKQLEKVVGKDAYEMLKQEKKPKIEIKFKLYEAIKEWAFH